MSATKRRKVTDATDQPRAAPTGFGTSRPLGFQTAVDVVLQSESWLSSFPRSPTCRPTMSAAPAAAMPSADIITLTSVRRARSSERRRAPLTPQTCSTSSRANTPRARLRPETSPSSSRPSRRRARCVRRCFPSQSRAHVVPPLACSTRPISPRSLHPTSSLPSSYNDLFPLN